MKKRLLSIIILFIIFISIPKISSKNDLFVNNIIDNLINSIDKNEGNLINDNFAIDAGSSVSDWYVISLSRYNYEDDYLGYRAILRDNIVSKYQTEGKLSKNLATEWHRLILASLASGLNPLEINSNINLVYDGIYSKNIDLSKQGLNGWIFGLLALDSYKFVVPNGDFYTRDYIIEQIIKNELNDGGFSLFTGGADPDITSMVIQALSPYYNSTKKYQYQKRNSNNIIISTVRNVIDRALNTLSLIQDEDGSFSSFGKAESTAQVLIALNSLGIDIHKDVRFIKNGNTVFDGLMQFRLDDGSFQGTSAANSIVSWQVLSGLVSYYRYLNNMRNFYDFRPEMDGMLKRDIRDLENQIDSLDKTDIGKVKQLFEEYINIPSLERMYVSNYYKLEKALIENNLDYILEEEYQGEIEFINKTFNFSEEDKTNTLSYNNVPKLRDKVIILSLIEKLNNSNYFDEYNFYRDKLNALIINIKIIETEIIDLNTIINENISMNPKVDENLILDIIKRYDALGEDNQGYIENYQDVLSAKAKIDSENRSKLIKIILIIFGILITVFFTIQIIYHIIKVRREEK